jgi:hypothetical protein
VSVTSLNPSTLAAVADQCVELADHIEEWGKDTPWMKNARSAPACPDGPAQVLPEMTAGTPNGCRTAGVAIDPSSC